MNRYPRDMIGYGAETPDPKWPGGAKIALQIVLNYEEGGENFQEKYFEMLKAGGSKHHKELLAPFGLDASDPAFWDKGLSMIEGFIDELEAMEG